MLAKHGLVTWGATGEESYARHDRDRLARGRGDRPARPRPLRHGRAEGRRARGRRRCRPARAGAARAARGAARGRGRRRARGRPEPRGRRLRLVRAGARGEPDRRAVPRPPDQHQAQAARRARSTRTATDAEELARHVPRRRRGLRRVVPRLLRADTSTRRPGPFPIDPAGPRVVLVPGVGIVTSGPDAGRARFARDLYHRAIAVRGRGRRARRVPVTERGRGLRDRVLAARALQARPGAAARRARRPGRLVTGGASGIGRATARLLASRGAHVVVADINAAGAEEVAAEIGGRRRARRRGRRDRRGRR